MKRVLIATAACLLAACATTEPAKKAEKAGTAPTMEKLLIGNLLQFDVASCGPRALELNPANTEVVMGALLSLAPAFQECFIDAKALDGAPLDVKVKAKVADVVSFEALGTGLTPAGKDCVLAAAKKLPLKPLAAGAKAIEAEVPVPPGVGSVAFGKNVVSDAAGTVRLSQPTLCECYAELGAQPAPTLAAKIFLTADKPAEFGIEPNDGSSLSTCALGKLQMLALPQLEAQVAVPFRLINAYATGPTEDAPAALQFQQYDAIRNQRSADVLIANGKRNAAAAAYDAVVAKYRAKPTPSLIGELRSKCAALVAGDEAWIGSLKTLVGVYEASLKLVKGESGKDPAWAMVEQRLEKQLAGTTAAITGVEGQKKSDEGICPKSK